MAAASGSVWLVGVLYGLLDCDDVFFKMLRVLSGLGNCGELSGTICPEVTSAA